MEPSLLHPTAAIERKLLEYLISLSTPSSVAGVGATSLSDVDLDTISFDCVLSRIQSGGAIDIAEGTEQYDRESTYPITDGPACSREEKGERFYTFVKCEGQKE
ncbi:hypothetical protein SAY87_014462 [Trapa incisa]|uniref:Uncharacterized protein n=1 Tax=Trapa incisa TaxID=236973 RepID=A0AAN7JDD2_9MYRT|nr:hypothetical protein SAY87_014462 [Trapa incisa]